ncbi:Cyclic nucleotide-gated cation channel beta-3 [Cichlidogyrus casuarinus]|uniref:Cyclic nucleotide-gated cation channel beta-3 n=1 Tax=Cichlidogyrus casuarinus TaxID=1844966 RepID=A0ABD2PUA1_9PLAT
MYIVKTGIVQVVGGPDNSIVFVELKEGTVFGEISLLAISGRNRRTANVRSKGFSTLFTLTKPDFEEAMKNYPQAYNMLKLKSQSVLFSQNLLLVNRRMLNKDKQNALEEQKRLRKEREEEIARKIANNEFVPEDELDEEVALEICRKRAPILEPKLVDIVFKRRKRRFLFNPLHLCARLLFLSSLKKVN